MKRNQPASNVSGDAAIEDLFMLIIAGRPQKKRSLWRVQEGFQMEAF
jgi:hypothetical protein